MIGRAGIGVDNIDVEAASKRGIVVMNTPGGNNVTTAEHAITLLLAMARNIPQASRVAPRRQVGAKQVHRRRGLRQDARHRRRRQHRLGSRRSRPGPEDEGDRLRSLTSPPKRRPERHRARLARRPLRARRLHLGAYAAHRRDAWADRRGRVRQDEEGRADRQLCARRHRRRGWRSPTRFATGQVAGAALDVFVEEPPPKDHPLLAPRRRSSPRRTSAPSTDEAQINVAIAIAEQVVDFLTRGEVRAAVNMPNLSAERLAVLRPFLALGEKVGCAAGADGAGCAPRGRHREQRRCRRSRHEGADRRGPEGAARRR